MFKRIVILGNGGSGKSTLARALQQKSGLPLVHLDQHYWQANGQAVSPSQWHQIHQALILSEQWIMEGTQYRELQHRLKRADKVIFLDSNPLLCCWRLMKKQWRKRATQDGYVYRNVWRNIWWVLRYNWRYRRKILRLLKTVQCPVEIRH